MLIYRELHQTIALFLPRILYIHTLSIYIYIENIIISILPLKLVSKYHRLPTCFAKSQNDLSQ